MTFDLDPETATIATIQTLVADKIKAQWRALGLRVLRKTLPAAGVTLIFGARELGVGERLEVFDNEEILEIDATVRRNEEEIDLMEARIRKGEEMKWEKERRRVGKRRVDRETERVEKIQHQEAEEEFEEADQEADEETGKEAAQLADELSASGSTSLEKEPVEAGSRGFIEELADTEEDLRVMEERSERVLVEVQQQREMRTDVDLPWEFVMEALEEDPFDENDADKENWNPQILRNLMNIRAGEALRLV